MEYFICIIHPLPFSDKKGYNVVRDFLNMSQSEEDLNKLKLAAAEKGVGPAIDKIIHDPKNVRAAKELYGQEPTEEDLVRYAYIDGPPQIKRSIFRILKKALG